MSETQSAASHAKMVPMYHYVAFGLLAVPTLYFLVQVVRDFSVGALMTALFAVGVIFVFFFARLFPLGVQDRVIRLEERIRLERALPDEMHGRIVEISTDVLIGLRFASDDELADLAQRVLGGELSDRKSVKDAIRNWRADHQRI
jgi:uncharacterized membrane protein YciS (DUF1049 family)